MSTDNIQIDVEVVDASTTPLHPAFKKTGDRIVPNGQYLHLAMVAASILYPPPVAEVLKDEINSWREWGYGLGGRRVPVLCDTLIKARREYEADKADKAEALLRAQMLEAYGT